MRDMLAVILAGIILITVGVPIVQFLLPPIGPLAVVLGILCWLILGIPLTALLSNLFDRRR